MLFFDNLEILYLDAHEVSVAATVQDVWAALPEPALSEAFCGESAQSIAGLPRMHRSQTTGGARAVNMLAGFHVGRAPSRPAARARGRAPLRGCCLTFVVEPEGDPCCAR